MRALMNSRAPISGFDSPSRASRAIRASWAVSSSARLGGALAGGLAGGQQLAPGALGERLHADRVEHVVGGAQLLARVDASALAAQPLAVEQVRAGELRTQPGAARADRSLREYSVARRRRRRSAAPASAPRSRAATSVPQGWVVSASRSSASRASSASPARAAASTSSGSARTVGKDLDGARRGLSGGRHSLLVAGEAVVQDRGRPMRVDRHAVPSPRSRSIAVAISAAASASLPCEGPRAVSAAHGTKRLPVAATTLSISAMSEAAPAKSPIHALARAKAD